MSFIKQPHFAFLVLLTLAASGPGLAQIPVHEGPGPDVVAVYGDSAQQLGYLRLPDGEGPFPVAVAIHGGCFLNWLGGDSLTPAAAALVEDGIATWDVTYRRLGHDGAGWPGTFLDVGAAVDHLRVLAETYPLDLERVVLFGHSAGAPLAVWAAGRNALPEDSIVRGENPLPVRAAIGIDGPMDLAGWRRQAIDARVCGEPVLASLMGGEPDAVPERYLQGSPVDMPTIDAEIVLLPASMMTAYGGHSAMEARADDYGERLTIRPVPESNHFQLITPGHPTWQPVRAAILEALGIR